MSCAALVLLALSRQAATPAALVLERSIELPGVEGRIDHLAVDLARGRLFVAALGNDSVEVVDLGAGKHLRSLGGPQEPQGILYLAELDRMVVACGESGTCDVYDGETFERVQRVEVGADADNLRYDPRSKSLWVACDAGALVQVDPTSWKTTARVALPAHPESFQLDRDEARAYVNVPGAHALVVVDLAAHAVRATWPMDEAGANFPMAIVPREGDAGARLLVGCRSPAKLVLRALPDGGPAGALDLSGDTDDVFYDARRRRVYAACGEGALDVFARDEQGAFHPLTKLATAPGARTALFVPERDQLLLAVPQRAAQRAEVRVYRLGD